MLELLTELPDNVVGVLARGHVTNQECNGVLRPAMESSLRRHDRLRLYYEIGSRFPGAGWEDLEIAVDHLPQWERIAIVTDTAWVRHTVNALRFLLASEVAVFTSWESEAARAWIAAPASAAAPRAATRTAPLSERRRSALSRARRAAARPLRPGDRRRGRRAATGS